MTNFLIRRSPDTITFKIQDLISSEECMTIIGLSRHNHGSGALGSSRDSWPSQLPLVQLNDRHRPLPYHLPLPSHSKPAYNTYLPGGPFPQMQRHVSSESTFLSRRLKRCVPV